MAYWLSVLPETQAALEEAGLWHDSENDYAPNGRNSGRKCGRGTGYCCTQCGVPEARGGSMMCIMYAPSEPRLCAGGQRALPPGQPDQQLGPSLLLLPSAVGGGVRTRSGLNGLEYALGNIAPST